MIDLREFFFINFNKSYDEIDERVSSLVLAMNSKRQIVTIASCHGHGILMKPPYVYFNTDVNTAKSIEKMLWQNHFEGRLNYLWILRGMFNENCELCFLLYATECDESSHSIIKSFLTFSKYFRKKLDADLDLLASLFTKTIL